MALAVIVTAGTAVAFTPTGGAQTATGADALTGEPAQNHLQTDGQVQTGESNQTGNLSASDVVQNARQSYDDIRNFNATVVSRTNVSNGTGAVDNITTKAKLSFEKPNDFRFKFLAPANQSGNIIISNGTTTLFYNASNNTYRTFSFNSSALGGMGTTNLSQTGYLDSINRTLTQSNVTYQGAAMAVGQETYVLSVEPTGLAANFTNNMTYYLDQDTYLPVKRVTQASLSFGNQTTSFTSTTLLRDVRVNVSMPEKVFDFNPPEGAQRVEGILSNVSASSYSSIEQARQNTSIRICEPSQVPAGYSFENATVSSLGNTTSVTLRYTNGSGGAFSVGIAEAMAGQQSNRSGIGQNVSVDGQSGTFIELGGQGTVTFTANESQYTVSGPFSQDTLVSIAASIDCAAGGDGGPDAGGEEVPEDSDLGENDADDDGDGAIDEDDEDDTDAPSNDDDDGDGAVDEDDEPDDGDDGSDDFNGTAEDDDDGDGAADEDDEADGGNSDDVDNDGDSAVDEDDEPDTDD